MKIALYSQNGKSRFGAITPGGAVNLDGRIEGIDTIEALLAGGASALKRAAEVVAKTPVDVPTAAIEYLPFVTPKARLICIGLNYQAHAAETGREKPKPNPGIFMRLHSSVNAHGEVLVVPSVSKNFDYEGEIAVIIGKPGKHIAEADALSHVAGYTIFMDGSVRDYQKNSVGAGKNFDNSAASGPWMVTADEIPDPLAMSVTTRLNGEVMQHSGVDRLIHSIPKSIAYLSGIVHLQPGDLIATGTPEGVGWHREPQVWMKAGDKLEIEVTGIGTLANSIVAEA